MPSYRENVRRHKKRSKLEAKYHADLRERSNRIHELEQKLLFAERPFRAQIEQLTVERDRLVAELAARTNAAQHMLLWCPSCGERHIDEGEFATKEHHTHACQHCGLVWRPAIGPTFGVRYLPGFKNRAEAEDLIRRLKAIRDDIAVVGHDDRPREIIDELLGLIK